MARTTWTCPARVTRSPRRNRIEVMDAVARRTPDDRLPESLRGLALCGLRWIYGNFLTCPSAAGIRVSSKANCPRRFMGAATNQVIVASGKPKGKA